MRTILLAALGACLLASGAVADGDGAAAPAPARTAEQIKNLRKAVLDGLADEKAKTRAAAGDLLVAAWPDSAAILDEALASASQEVRIEGVYLLARPELGDVLERVRGKLADAGELVRRAAVRVLRHVKAPDVEPALVDVVSQERSWLVRQEALRGLEERGTAACLRVVLDRWCAEKDLSRKERHRRVLAAVLGTDCGDDASAWRDAVAAAERKARTGRAK